MGWPVFFFKPILSRNSDSVGWFLCPFRHELQRRLVIQIGIRSKRILMLTPIFNNHPRVSTAVKLNHCQTFVFKLAIKAFISAVLVRLAGLNKKIAHPFICSPLKQSQAHKLWPSSLRNTEGQSRSSINFSSTSMSWWLSIEPAT
jgi:hypothetical protein